MPQATLFFTRDFDAAKAEIMQLGGRVTLKLSPSVLVAILPETVAPDTLQKSSLTHDFALDDNSELMVRAWGKVRGSNAVEAKKDARRWGTGGRLAPRNAYNDPKLRAQFSEYTTGTPTSLVMTGSVIVGLYLVSGSTSQLAFSDAEKDTLTAEVITGLHFLGAAEPSANLTFEINSRAFVVSAAAPSSCPDYETCEAVWRDPALQQLGYPSGLAGCVTLASDLKAKGNWSYLAFFTKYPLYHFAYASGVRLCMQYPADGYSDSQINQVFAHETCHIFGAADEYDPCTCDKKGYDNVPNGNCHSCTTSQVPCLMDQNDLEICEFTRGQLGWTFWEPIVGSFLAPSVGSDGTVYLLDSAGNFGQYTDAWKLFPPPPNATLPIRAIAVRSATSIMVADSSNCIFIYQNGAWGAPTTPLPNPVAPMPNGVALMTFSRDGSWIVLDRLGALYTWTNQPPPQNFYWRQVSPSSGKWLSVSCGGISNTWGIKITNRGESGEVWVNTDGDWFTGTWNKVADVPGGAADISVASDGSAWAVNPTGQVFRYSTSGWILINGQITRIRAASASDVWGQYAPLFGNVNQVLHRKVLESIPPL